jgi:hypothetical protein
MKNHILTFDEFLNESTHSNLEKFLGTTLSDESKGYYWIFTNSTIRNGVFTGNINDEGGHGKFSRSEVEKDLENDKKVVDKKLKLLKQAIDEFNRENKTSLKHTYKLNKPVIKTGRRQGDTTYDADSLVASVTIK